MRSFLALLLVLGVGVVLGRMFDGAPQAKAGRSPLPPCQDIDGDGNSNPIRVTACYD